ncbi:MAG: hypothetical protein JWN74_371 [Acidobacteriaceae bacterium]|nr:hypothetical protein [Acidobacteriaceae bacterium]
MTRYFENVSRSSVSSKAKAFGPQAPMFLLAATFLLVALGSPIRCVAESTIACPAGTYDMLDWMTLDSDLRSNYHMEGTSNPLYTVMQSDKFYWVKGGLGYPWDIQLYDSKYVYLWVTELSWTVPQSYKKFTNNTNLPLVPRCATAGTSTAGSTIKVANTKLRTAYKLLSDLLSDPGPPERDQSGVGTVLLLIRGKSAKQLEDFSDQLSL